MRYNWLIFYTHILMVYFLNSCLWLWNIKILLKILVFEAKIKDFEVIPSDESNIKVNKTILDSPKNNIRKIVIKKTEQIIDIESLENISTFFLD